MTGTLLITGTTGQVGTELVRQAPAAGWRIAAYDRGALDITDPGAVAATIGEVRPAVVVNAAAYTAVDRAETERDAAFAVNRDGPAYLAEACAKHDAALLHLSTDYVFSGIARAAPWHPRDTPVPINTYGASKLAGEEAVRASGARAAIIRTAWIFSAQGHNFVRTMLRLGHERSHLTIVDDQLGAPTPAADLAAALLTAATRMGAEGVTGTFHYCGHPAVTWYAFAQAIFAELASSWPTLPQVVPVASDAYPTPARRPAYSVLDTGDFEASFGVPARDWRPGLRRVLTELDEIEAREDAR